MNTLLLILIPVVSNEKSNDEHHNAPRDTNGINYISNQYRVNWDNIFGNKKEIAKA